MLCLNVNPSERQFQTTKGSSSEGGKKKEKTFLVMLLKA